MSSANKKIGLITKTSLVIYNRTGVEISYWILYSSWVYILTWNFFLLDNAME